jgi:hypothetical protein
MSRSRQAARLVAVVGFEIGCLGGLFLLGQQPWLRIRWSDWGTWVRITPAEDAIAAFAWLAAVACAIWLMGSTLVYTVARVSRVPALIRSVEWMTLPAIRRVTDRVLAAVLVAATMTATPVRAEPPPPVLAVVDQDGPWLPPGLTGPASPGPGRNAGPTGVPDPGKPPAAAVEAAAEVVQVRSGDNLWVISRRHLTGALGRVPASDEIAPYWRQVIARNRPHLLSGNPDLIYPGEVIRLPPTG